MKGAEKKSTFENSDYIIDGKSGFITKEGYISGICKAAAILILFIFSYVSVSAQTGNTWYNYSVDNSDNWDDWKRWTLDPDGSLLINPLQQYPKATDTVVILNGSTVNITTNTREAAVLEIKSGGILNISGTSTGHNFSVIKGDGRIKLSADNYPAGDDTEFRNHGTVEYNGGGYTLNINRTYYNLVINLNNASDVITLMNDLSVNNDFSVNKGIFQINDNASTVKKTIQVRKDVTVQNQGQIKTGQGNTANGYTYGNNLGSGLFHSIFHQLYIGGNLTNFGIIQFTNRTAPLYNNFVNNGAVTVTFNGLGNNDINLYGSTLFYNLVIDKGNNQTYVAKVYSANQDYFKLYGPNSLDRIVGADAANPEVRKALWIKNGTLRLTGNINIPSLTEANNGEIFDLGFGDYTIPKNGCLWIDGNNVIINGTNDNEDVNGVVKRTSETYLGFLDIEYNFQGLIIYGKFRISNGTYNGNYSNGIKLDNADDATFLVEGGLVDICQFRGALLTSGKATYQQTGGTVNVRGDEGGRGWLRNDIPFIGFAGSPLFGLEDVNSVFIMSGGALNLSDVTTTATNSDFAINSSDGNYNVTGGNINIRVNGGENFDINSKANLWNLHIANANPASGTFTARLLQSIRISNNLTIRDTTYFDPYNNANNVTIGGNLTIGSSSGSTTARFYPRNNTTTFDGSGNSTITVSNNNPTYYFNPYHLVINKENENDTVLMAYRPLTPASVIGTVKGDFTINKGIFDYKSYSIDVNGNLNNSGVMGTFVASGRIRLNNGLPRTITTSVSGNPLYGHIELDEPDGAALALNNAEFSNFTLTNGILNIGDFRLTVDNDSIYGSGFSSTKMVQVSGDHGARGLRLKLNADYNKDNVIIYPVGTPGEYTYARVLITEDINPVNGYLTVSPVPLAHPTHETGNSINVMSIYWKTIAENLSNIIANVQYDFYYDNSFPNYGKEYYFLGTNWIMENDNCNSPLTFEQDDIHGFATGDFTGGENNGFKNVSTVYSMKSGNWTDGTVWNVNREPNYYEFVEIRSGHTVTMNQNNKKVASLRIKDNGVLDIANSVGDTLYKVSGSGKIRISSTNTVAGNFDEFLNNDTAVWEYYGNAYTIPNLNNVPYYPNLLISGTGVKTLPNANKVVRNNMIVDASTALLNLNNRNINIYDSLIIKNGGVLQFPNTGTCILTVNKSADLSRGILNKIEIATGGTAGTPHKLYVKDDIVMNDNAEIHMYNGTTKKANLYFTGDGNSVVTSSLGHIDLNYLYIQKNAITDTVAIRSAFSLTNNLDNTLVLSTGSLQLDHSGLDINLTATGRGNFIIPETGRMSVLHGIIRVTGDNNGIKLNNRLRLQHNSQLFMNLNQNNYIEYSSTGKSELLIEDSARLTVGGQIRRSLNTESGLLIYKQTGIGSVVTVGDRSAGDPSRGMFEILNPGSNFTHTGGSLIIGRGQNNVDPALYLDTETYSISGGAKIIFGNTNTPASQNIGIYSAIPLKDLEVSNAGATKSVTVYTLPLNIDSLRILDGQTFNANSNDINLKGNLHLFNSAAYTPGSNTTSFSGSRQKIIGGITFHNLTVTTSDSVRLYDDITINNTFSINSGSQISDRQKKITLKGNIVNDGRHYSESMNVGGLIFQGSTRQKIAGAGIYGIMIVNNNNGVELQNNFTLVDRNVRLQNGSFFLREYQLAIGEKANITADGGFSKDRMLVTNGAVSDLGIKKYVPSGTSSDIFFPIGVTGKYTPVTFTNLAVTESGYVFIRPVNLAHPTALDPSNVLQYYWNIQTSNFTSFNAHINFKYLNSDVRVTAPNLESDYIPAYLNDVSWAKFGSENVDEVNDTISFTFNTGTNIDGDFTAGINTAIPDKVPVYYTVKNGNWEDPAIWAREDGLPVTAFPNGYVVRIRHNVTVSADLKSAYKTIIEQGGKVDIGTTIRHYFGVVSGRGHLSLSTGRLPAGNYRQFFTCDGGTIEYGGSTSYEIPNESLFYRRLIFSGGGTKVLASNDITVCDTLLINGPVVDNSTHDNQITIKGLLEKTSGTFNAGTGSNATIVFSGTIPQQIKGDFTGASILNNIVMNNAAGLTMGGNVTMAGKLTLSNGAITTGSNTFLMEIASTVTPVAGSATSFINGPLHKKLANGSDFTFPVGKGTRNGYVSLLSTSTADERIWKAEYFNTGYTDLTTSPATFKVTGSEYWKINSAVDNDGAIVKLRWDALSDINPLTTTNGINDIRVAEYNGTDWVEKPSSASGNSSAGTVQTSSVIPIKISSNPQYYTLGSISTLKPTITLGTNPQVCLGSISASLPYLALSGSPVDYAIDYDVTAQGQGFLDKGWTALPSSPVNLTIPATATAGTYNATIQVRNATIASVPYSFTVRILPGNAISAASSTPSVCINTPLSVTHSSTGATGIGTPSGLPSGVNAAWSANTVTISGTPVVSGIYNYSIPLSGGCGNVSATGTITVNSLPTVSILFTESSGSISNDGTICKGDQVVITAGGGTSYLWSPAAGLSATNIANPVAVPTATTTYTVTVTDNNSCINMANALVTVMPIPATGDMYRKPNN